MNISQNSVNRVKNKFEMGKDLFCNPMEKCKKKEKHHHVMTEKSSKYAEKTEKELNSVDNLTQ